MKKITLSPNVSVKLYDSIDIPVMNYGKFQKYLIYETGLGTSAEQILGEIQKAAVYINENKLSEATEQLNNVLAGHYLAMNEVSPKDLSFACLIHSVNENKVEDYDDVTLQELLEDLSSKGLTKEILVKEFLDVKKKLISSF